MLEIKPIPVPLGSDHPDPKHSELPKHEFTMGFIAPKGAGKTTLICNLLMAYKNYFHSIVVFSPTVENDEKWDYVKKQKLLAYNHKLKKFIEKQKVKKQSGIVDRLQEIPDIEMPDEEDFDGRIPADCFFLQYSDDDLKAILDEQDQLVKWLHDQGQPKYLANRILFVFDDLVGSNLFSNARQNLFKLFNVRHRHFSASILMVSQGYKEIPKTIRTGYSCLILFEIPNEAELKTIYEEFPMGMKWDDWLQVYNYCVEGDFNFLFYNLKVKEKRLRIMKNFSEHVFIEKD